jgi:hypothetical protein
VKEELLLLVILCEEQDSSKNDIIVIPIFILINYCVMNFHVTFPTVFGLFISGAETVPFQVPLLSFSTFIHENCILLFHS